MADPREARPLPGVPALLEDLARRFALVAVISGRPTAFLADVLGSPDRVVLAGLYGLERALRGPAHDAWAGLIDAVVAEALAEAPPGVYVEPKGLTVTLHWRQAPEQKDWVVAFAERQHAERDLLVHEGRHERELRPPLDVDKGTVVRSLVAEHDAGNGAGTSRSGTWRRSATTSGIFPPSPRWANWSGPTAAASMQSASPPSTPRVPPPWRPGPT